MGQAISLNVSTLIVFAITTLFFKNQHRGHVDPENNTKPGNSNSDEADMPVIFEDKNKKAVRMDDLQYHNISRENFHRCLKLYEHHVRDVYQHVEKQRFEIIPNCLKKRDPQFLTKADVLNLDRWMQKRGRRLQSNLHMRNENFVRRNEEENVKKKTELAFQKYSKNDPFGAMRALAKLSGIGHSRACLLLSVAYPDDIPYLSTQLCQWIFPDKPPDQTKDHQYRKEGFERVDAIKARIGVMAIEVEKVAFVLDCESGVSELRRPEIFKPSSEPIAQGTFGYVYQIDGLASQEEKGKVAIKHIFKTPQIQRHRLFTEILDSSLLAEKSPQHFVKFFGWNETDSSFLLAMEYIEFGNLRACLNPEELSWTEGDKKDTTRQILEGLKIMHSLGLTHRDLKPEVRLKYLYSSRSIITKT
ncbi:kinase-like domain-containing protein [Jackrogersella minutella]|nr:kinase-like domain-containing protein [Jackrogersella minutella]